MIGTPRERARRALRDAMARERRRVRTLRRILRAAIAGAVLFGAWCVIPGTVPSEVVPLLTLAERAEASPGTPQEPGTFWYSRTEQVRLVIVPADMLPDGDRELRFLLPSIHETWFSESEDVRRRMTVGVPGFLSPGDERRFRDARLGDVYGVDHVLEDDAILDRATMAVPPPLEAAVDEGRAALVETLRAHAADDPRLREVEMLRLASRLVHRFSGDPARRGIVLRAMTDLPGIAVETGEGTVDVSIDFVDGDRPLRLSYMFDADSAQLVTESLVELAGRLEVSSVLRQTTFSTGPVRGAFGS